MIEQNYEYYWKLTLEYSDINSDKFIGTLQLIIDFIKNNENLPYKSERYEILQNKINHKFPKKDMGSVRKSINQFVKLGFIHSKLVGYNKETEKFLEAKTNKKRKSFFSKIIYKYSSFNSSITHHSEQKEINFLLKTLEEVGKLHKNDIIRLMRVDIATVSKGYLTVKELNSNIEKVKSINFKNRKYNQISYLWGLLKKLDDLVIINNELYFEDDAKVIFGEDLKKETKKRDGYLHRIYKNLLKEEVEEKLNHTQCMVEKLSYPSLVASHIKPFINSDSNEAYDHNNGLLLSRNMDILFDQGYISFEDNGNIMCSKQLQEDVKLNLDHYNLDIIFINENRIQYFNYHRNNVFKKNT